MKKKRLNTLNNFSCLSSEASFTTPNPHPGRGVYGFALYLFFWILLIIYFIWAFLPNCLLKALHLTYLPSKYWAVSLPLLFPIILGVHLK